MPKVLNKYKIKPEETGVYIGRPSVYRNPYPISTQDNRDKVCDKHILYLLGRPDAIAWVQENLKGKNLICFCAPARCHGDFLLRLANEKTKPFVIAKQLLMKSSHWNKIQDLMETATTKPDQDEQSNKLRDILRQLNRTQA
jgi:hypothetical protein